VPATAIHSRYILYISFSIWELGIDNQVLALIIPKHLLDGGSYNSLNLPSDLPACLVFSGRPKNANSDFRNEDVPPRSYLGIRLLRDREKNQSLVRISVRTRNGLIGSPDN